MSLRRWVEANRELTGKPLPEGGFSYHVPAGALGYIFEDEDYIIRPAGSVKELINESAKLHHCVKTYADKIIKGETAIFFIRKKDKPNEPYYTLEWNKGAIIQCRTKNNKSYEGEVREFVDKWVAECASKVSKKRKKAA
jgi:hypothetical protein